MPRHPPASRCLRAEGFREDHQAATTAVKQVSRRPSSRKPDQSAERLESLTHRGGVGEAVLGVAGEALLDDRGKAGGDVGPTLADRHRLLFEEHADQVAAALRLVVDELAGEQVIERRGRGVEVGQRGDGLEVEHLLGGHERHGAAHLAREGQAREADAAEALGQAEVGDLGDQALGRLADQDVLGLDVAVDEAQPVGLLQPLEDLAGQPAGLVVG